MTCWVCGQPAVWKVNGKKVGTRPKTQDDEGSPDILVEFFACETHVPFALTAKGTAK